MYIKCKYCGHIGLRGDFEIDHPLPIARASFVQLLNQKLELICSGCNRQKGKKTPIEYILWRSLNPREANFGPIR